MTTSADRERAVLEMLASAQIAGPELEERIRNASDATYWERLNPALSVGRRKNAADLQDSLPDAFGTDPLVDSFRREGWMRTPRLLRPGFAAAMRDAIVSMRRGNWPEVFAYVYDEFWLAPRVPALVEILERVLGTGYRQLPHIWGHYVAPGSSGWSPHTDGSGPERLTLWFALSDATLENSCMYLIPAHRTPASIAGRFPETDTVERRDLYTLLQHARAIPAPAGSALSWHHHVIHWGAPSYATETPRISCSQEFLAPGVTPTDAEKPLLDTGGEPPTLDQRLDLITTAILAYQHYEPAMIRHRDLATGIRSSLNRMS